MKWTSQHINQLAKQGKIRGFKASSKKAGILPQKSSRNIPGKKSKALDWLDLNLQQWSRENKLKMEMEYRFDPIRKWRFDYCWPSLKIAVEFEGGIFLQKSGHNTAKHYTKDTEKYNCATVLGWRVIRVTASNYMEAPKRLNELIKKSSKNL